MKHSFANQNLKLALRYLIKNTAQIIFVGKLNFNLVFTFCTLNAYVSLQNIAKRLGNFLISSRQRLTRRRLVGTHLFTREKTSELLSFTHSESLLFQLLNELLLCNFILNGEDRTSMTFGNLPIEKHPLCLFRQIKQTEKIRNS